MMEDLNYTPKNPLPEEIKKMPQEEAACKYCGVSYLILSEVQRLRTQIAAMERELSSLRKSGERERALMEDIQRLTVQQKELLRELETTRQENSMMKNELQTKRDEYSKIQLEGMENATRLKEVLVENSNLSAQLSNLRFSLKDLLIKHSEIRASHQSVIELHEQSQSHFLASLNEVRQNIKSCILDFIEDQRKFVAVRLEAAECERETLRSEKEHLASLTSSVNGDLANLREAKAELLKQLSSLNDEKVKLEKELDATNAAWRHKLTDYETRVKSLQKDRDELSSERSTLLSKLSDLERSTSTQSETVRSFMDEKDRLTKELKVAKVEMNKLQDERSDLVRSHQSRIEQLRVSYEDRMKELEAANEELKARCNEKQAENNSALRDLENQLRADFERALQIERQKSADLIDRYKREAQSANQSAKALSVGEHAKYKEEIAALKQSLTSEKQQLEQATIKYSDELNKARSLIDKLQTQLERDTIERNRQDAEFTTLRRERDRFDEVMQQSRRQVGQLEDELEASKREVRTLQSMVQRECEERLELAEALQNAKEQLLALKLPINLVSTNSSRGSSHSLNSIGSGAAANGNGHGNGHGNGNQASQYSSRRTSASSGVIDAHRSAADSQSESGTSLSSAKLSNVTLRPINAKPAGSGSRRINESPEELARRRILAAMSRPKV